MVSHHSPAQPKAENLFAPSVLNKVIGKPQTGRISWRAAALTKAAVRYERIEKHQSAINWMKSVGPDTVIETFREIFLDFDIVANCKP